MYYLNTILGTIIQTCDPSTQEAELGGSGVHGHPQLHT